MQVQVVVRTDRVILTRRSTEQLERAIGEHLVDVHVGGRSCAALQGVDENVLVEPAFHHLPARGLDRRKDRFVEHSQFAIRHCGRQLDGPVGPDQFGADRATRKGKVLRCPQGMDPVQSGPWQLARAQQIGFSSKIHGIRPLVDPHDLCHCLRASSAPHRY